jgi:hypothetical protein
MIQIVPDLLSEPDLLSARSPRSSAILPMIRVYPSVPSLSAFPQPSVRSGTQSTCDGTLVPAWLPARGYDRELSACVSARVFLVHPARVIL